MRRFALNRFALTMIVAGAFLASCDGSQPQIGAPGATNLPIVNRERKRSRTLSYSGSPQSFNVPFARWYPYLHLFPAASVLPALAAARGEVFIIS